MEQVIIALLMLAACAPRCGLPADNWRVGERRDHPNVLRLLTGAELRSGINVIWHLPEGEVVNGGSGTAAADAEPGQPEMMEVISDIFRSEGVPRNLAWLAQVESDLDPEAVSRAGAVGLFQLMPATAERFGLRVFPEDDRKKPEKSARAAALYLRQLHKEFGAWTLALAAYNAGEGRVRRTLKAQNASTYLEIVPHLPAETRRYVPRVMAITALREDQRRGISTALFIP